MNTISLITALFFLFSLDLVAQDQAAQRTSDSLVREGVIHADRGELDEALRLYERARTVDPGNASPVYEIAYVHYSRKEYRDAADLLQGILGSERAEGIYFQLLGNCYDMLGDSARAIATYKQGLERFPESGSLYLELGIMSLGAKDLATAVNYWEQGIYKAPTFPSNYYWAARAYCGSSERIWGVLYGEIFLNLERNSARTQEISRLLFNTYGDAFVFRKDSSAVRFVTQMTVVPPEEGKDIVLPFEMQYETGMMMAMLPAAGQGDSAVSLANLDMIRTEFANNWHGSGNDTVYQNVLLAWHKALIDNGYFSAYNHWLMSQGAADEFERWYAADHTPFDTFAEWFSKHPMPIDGEHFFSRLALQE